MNMRTLLYTLALAGTTVVSTSAQAWWGPSHNGNNWGPWGGGSDWGPMDAVMDGDFDFNMSFNYARPWLWPRQWLRPWLRLSKHGLRLPLFRTGSLRPCTCTTTCSARGRTAGSARR